MDKRKRDDGFTLIEMILVLFLVSLLLLLFPIVSLKGGSVIRMQVETLRYRFLEGQSRALHEKVRVSIVCDGYTCLIDEEELQLENKMRCFGKVDFNESGNASRATTFSCLINSYKQDLIVQLGSGRMYVR